MSGPAFVFPDGSGDLEITAEGTRHFILASPCVHRPISWLVYGPSGETVTGSRSGFGGGGTAAPERGPS